MIAADTGLAHMDYEKHLATSNENKLMVFLAIIL